MSRILPPVRVIPVPCNPLQQGVSNLVPLLQRALEHGGQNAARVGCSTVESGSGDLGRVDRTAVRLVDVPAVSTGTTGPSWNCQHHHNIRMTAILLIVTIAF